MTGLNVNNNAVSAVLCNGHIKNAHPPTIGVVRIYDLDLL